MCPTVLGRLETRTVTLLGPALLGAILSLVTGNEGFIVIIGVYLLMGTVLDIAIYPFIVRWQPPWLTFVLAIGEFVILYTLSQILKIGLAPVDAVWFFWVSWTIANWTKIVILPIVSLSWIENAGEFRSTGWAVPPDVEPIPVLALISQTSPAGAGGLVREFSTIGTVPDELRRLPAPSGVHETPVGIG
jgi:hypothetical protein